jgi:hypothetical protein
MGEAELAWLRGKEPQKGRASQFSSSETQGSRRVAKRIGERAPGRTGDSPTRIVDERLLEKVESGFVQSWAGVGEVLRMPLGEGGLVVWERLNAWPDVVVRRPEETGRTKAETEGRKREVHCQSNPQSDTPLMEW